MSKISAWLKDQFDLEIGRGNYFLFVSEQEEEKSREIIEARWNTLRIPVSISNILTNKERWERKQKKNKESRWKREKGNIFFIFFSFLYFFFFAEKHVKTIFQYPQKVDHFLFPSSGIFEFQIGTWVCMVFAVMSMRVPKNKEE